ncbi:MAG: glycerol-3-phosphate 1-O-acyltransferase PlsY [Myxococcota bacterium]
MDLANPQLLTLVVLSYLLGAVPFGLVLVRWRAHTDVRLAGSGNIGATNVARVAGKGLGVITLLLDAMKGALPVTAARMLGVGELGCAVVGAAAFLGHCFPVYLRFKGGKGIATGFGVVLAMRPPVALLAAAVYGITFLATRISSVSSLTALVAVGAAAGFVGLQPELWGLFATMLAVIVVKHIPNIRRLLGGKESRL